MEYKHTQRGWLGVPFVGFGLIVIIVVIIASGGSDSGDLGWILAWTTALLVMILLVVLHFSRLTVTVDDTAVTAGFGFIDRPKRVIRYDEVVSVERVRNKWWYGYGVRWIPGGSMFNVQGNDAVELTYTDGRKFRIGTNDVENLYAVLQEVIGS